jgi:hypothetical protein
VTHFQRRQHTNHIKGHHTTLKIIERKAHNNCLHKTGNNNRRTTTILHCPHLDHHDADGLAGQKLGKPPRPPREDTNTPYIQKVFITFNILNI